MMTAIPTELVALIVADYRDGIYVNEIARRRNVSHETVCKYAKRAGLYRNKPKGERPSLPCQFCGTTCRSSRHMCRECAVIHNVPELDEDDGALDGGRWVIDLRRRVQVWVPDTLGGE